MCFVHARNSINREKKTLGEKKSSSFSLSVTKNTSKILKKKEFGSKTNERKRKKKRDKIYISMLSSSSSLTASKLPSIVGYSLSCIFWFPVTISGCMSLYVVGASRQGLSWFSFKHNPYLHLQLFAGAGAIAAAAFKRYSQQQNQNQIQKKSDVTNAFLSSLSATPPKPIILLAGMCWGAYAAVITKQRWHFREWRYILSAHVPLLVLLGSYLAQSM